MPTGNLSVIDRLLIDLPPEAKIHALLAAKRIPKNAVALRAGVYAANVTQTLTGERRYERVRDALAEVLGAPRREIDVALDSITPGR